MKKLTFTTTIDAPRERVWQTLWNDATYRLWTSVFHEGSYAESDWQEGSKILFLGPGGDGMSSRIARLIPNEFMSFEHLGEIKNGVEEHSKNWAGALENYTLRQQNGGTELLIEMDADDSFAEYAQKTFPQALDKVKEVAEARKITPFLWFDTQAEEAANFYTSIFQNSKIEKIQRNGDAVMVVDFTLCGQHFGALNGGPHFKINPSVSFYVTCETEAETDTVWQKLTEGGKVMIPMEKQAWSQKYGFAQDRFGVCWQISWGKLSDVGGQKFVPSLLFSGAHAGQAEAALQLYTSLFKGSAVEGIQRYGAGEAGKEGTVMHAQARLYGQTFMFMDNPMPEDTYTFNEALSFVVNCQGQEEVDYFWEKLTANGGAESQCGWLKDPFGVSWQIVPDELPQLLADPDPARAQRAMGAMMTMQKIDIEKLRKAADGEGKTTIVVEATVAAPLEKVWERWTQPEHVVHWNNASDDWHTPRAENDLRPGGTFNYRMEARDGSFGFDFNGTYDNVEKHQRIEYTMGDDRKVQVTFSSTDAGTFVMETFEAENTHSVEMQQQGWQAILNNFKKYVESN